MGEPSIFAASNREEMRRFFWGSEPRDLERGVNVSAATRRAFLLDTPRIVRGGRVCTVKFTNVGGGVWRADLEGWQPPVAP